MKIVPVTILGKECTPRFGKYKNGQIGVFFYSRIGEPVIKATVNLKIPLEEDKIMAKDFECYNYLLASGIVSETVAKVSYGYNCEAYICKMALDPEKFPQYQL